MQTRKIPKTYIKGIQEAEALFKNNDLVNSGKVCVKLIKEFPDYAQAYNALGLITKEIGDLEKAFPMFQRAIAAQPEVIQFYKNASEVCIKVKAFPQAATILEEAYKRAPDDAEVMQSLADTYCCLKRNDEAIPLYEKCLELKPELAGEIEHLLRAQKGEQLDKGSDEYVKKLFNYYADNFEEHLTSSLEYKTPELLAQLIDENCNPNGKNWSVLDAGCGTGLMGDYIYPNCKELIGVDLADKMVKATLERTHDGNKVYTHGFADNAENILPNYKDRLDGVIAADVFVYVGNLDNMFKVTKESLTKDGWFAFSVEHLEEPGFSLQKSGRFAHSRQYIDELCEKHGFKQAVVQQNKLRKERGEYIIGDVYVLHNA